MCCTVTKNKHKDIKVAIKVEEDHLDVPEEWEEYPQLGDYPPDDPSLDGFVIFVNGDEVFICTNNEAYLEWASGQGNVIKLFKNMFYIFRLPVLLPGVRNLQLCFTLLFVYIDKLAKCHVSYCSCCHKT